LILSLVRLRIIAKRSISFMLAILFACVKKH
jgi:hypothetical protein